MENIKIAKTQYPVMDAIKDRWSPRSFSEKALTENDTNTIIEAASWAFSSNNSQPWNYIVGLKGDATFQKLVDCLMPGNSPWAKNAAALILSIAINKSADGKANPVALHDVGAANTLLTLQANSMDVYTHLMGGFDRAKATEVFAISPDHSPVVIIALGYLDSPEKLISPYKERELTPRTRKPLSEIILKAV